MRKVLIALATAASALAVAAPASAQIYVPQQPVPYGAPYGNAHGYNNWGQVRSLQVRVDNLQRQIERLDNRDRISEREARRLREDARSLERRLHAVSRNGLSPNEAASINARIQGLEQRVWREAHDRNGYDNRRRWAR